MTVREIIKEIVKVRGATLCLGLNGFIHPRVLGFDDVQADEDKDGLVMLPLAEGRDFTTFRLPVALSGSEETNETEYLNLNVAGTDFSMTGKVVIFSDIRSIPVKLLSHVIEYFNIGNILLFDEFPFNTDEGGRRVEAVRAEVEAFLNVSLSIGLICGLNRYSSTDISSEQDAVEKEFEFWSRKGIRCVVIDSELRPDQTLDVFSPNPEGYDRAIAKLRESCDLTDGNMQIAEDMLEAILQIELGQTAKHYVEHVRTQMQVLKELFPVSSYIGDDFYYEFEKKVGNILRKSRDSELATTATKKSVSVLMNMLRKWIKNK